MYCFKVPVIVTDVYRIYRQDNRESDCWSTGTSEGRFY